MDKIENINSFQLNCWHNLTQRYVTYTDKASATISPAKSCEYVAIVEVNVIFVTYTPLRKAISNSDLNSKISKLKNTAILNIIIDTIAVIHGMVTYSPIRSLNIGSKNLPSSILSFAESNKTNSKRES